MSLTPRPVSPRPASPIHLPPLPVSPAFGPAPYLQPHDDLGLTRRTPIVRLGIASASAHPSRPSLRPSLAVDVITSGATLLRAPQAPERTSLARVAAASLLVPPPTRIAVTPASSDSERAVSSGEEWQTPRLRAIRRPRGGRSPTWSASPSPLSVPSPWQSRSPSSQPDGPSSALGAQVEAELRIKCSPAELEHKLRPAGEHAGLALAVVEEVRWLQRQGWLYHQYVELQLRTPNRRTLWAELHRHGGEHKSGRSTFVGGKLGSAAVDVVRVRSTPRDPGDRELHRVQLVRIKGARRKVTLLQAVMMTRAVATALPRYSILSSNCYMASRFVMILVIHALDNKAEYDGFLAALKEAAVAKDRFLDVLRPAGIFGGGAERLAADHIAASSAQWLAPMGAERHRRRELHQANPLRDIDAALYDRNVRTTVALGAVLILCLRLMTMFWPSVTLSVVSLSLPASLYYAGAIGSRHVAWPAALVAAALRLLWRVAARAEPMVRRKARTLR